MYHSILYITSFYRTVVRCCGGQAGRAPSRAPSTYIITAIVGTPKVIPTPDFRISPGGRKHRKTQENRE